MTQAPPQLASPLIHIPAQAQPGTGRVSTVPAPSPLLRAGTMAPPFLPAVEEVATWPIPSKALQLSALDQPRENEKLSS